MPSIQRIVITTPESSDQFKSICELGSDDKTGATNLATYIASVPSGVRSALIDVKVGAVQATATIVSTGTATNNETMLLLNQTITAKTSGAVAANGEFNISGTPATQAANIAAAINAMSTLTGKVSAAAVSGTVTVTALVPGLIGNGLQISESLSNVTVTQFTGGTDGTAYELDLD